MALSMFTVIPTPKVWEQKALNWVIPNLPVVGFIIGFINYGFARLLRYQQVSTILASVLIFVLPLILSGFIHLDGYMDVSDAISSRADMTKKHAILVDPHVGAFAVIALGVYLLMGGAATHAALLTNMPLRAFLFIPVVSRCGAGLLLFGSNLMKQTGFAATFRKDASSIQIIVIALMLVGAMLAGYLLAGQGLVLTLVVALFATAFAGKFAIKQLDGVSGDVCGFAITIGELTAFLWLAFNLF